MSETEKPRYIDCKCVLCGWAESFRSRNITKGLVGGWCESCKRESVFLEVTATDSCPHCQAMRAELERLRDVVSPQDVVIIDSVLKSVENNPTQNE